MKPAPRPATTRAILYLRQSVAREDSISLELQEVAGRDYCERRGYTVVGVESDPGISGRTWKRPAVQRVMTAIEAHDADVIVLWKWSRLSRSRLDWAVAVDRVESCGGRIESATEPLDTTTASGRFARGMLAEFAAFESERIGDVWRESHARRRRVGLPAQGGDRFGYVREGNTFTPDETTGPLLAEMFRRYNSGQGFTRIAAWMNDVHSEAWDRSRVTRLLDSGFGAGQIVHGRGKNAVYHPGIHEPVIELREWDEYRARRAQAPAPPRTVEPVYLLSGLVKCGDCGSPMHAYNASGNGPGSGYICSRWVRAKMGRCVSTRRHIAERAVTDWLSEWAEQMTAANVANDAEAARRVVKLADRDRLARRLHRLTADLGNLASLYAQGKLSEVAYEAGAAKMQSDIDLLSKRLTETPSLPPVVEVGRMLDALELWDRVDVAARREVLRQIVRRVVVHPPEKPYGPVRVEVEAL
jgi:site-specific DNA recombinase